MKMHACATATLLMATVLGLAFTGCATGAEKGESTAEPAAKADAAKRPAGSVMRPRGESREDEREPETEGGSTGEQDLMEEALAVRSDSFAGVVRAFASTGGGGIALMSGLEGLTLEKVPEPKDARALAKALTAVSECEVQSTPNYEFVYWGRQPYEALTQVSLEGKLDPSYKDLKAGMSFGADTRLFTVLAALGSATRRTFVADNGLAEMHCGELALNEVPLESALEALLKSARVLRFNVDSTDEYVFISTTANKNAPDLLLNPDGLTDAQRSMLEKRVTVYLPVAPSTPGHLVSSPGAQELHDVLRSLSQQMGVPVTATSDLASFPVNPAVFNNVRVRTALNLVVRQWLRPDYGYTVEGNRIVIRRR